MTEKYFIYSALIFFAAAIILPMIFVRYFNRLKFLQKLVRINVLKRQQKAEIPVLFASEILQQSCEVLFKKHNFEAKTALLMLTIGKVQKAVSALYITHPQLSLLLWAHADALAAYKKMLKHKKLFSESPKYGVYFPLTALLLFDFKTAYTALAKIKPQKIKSRTLGYYNYLTASAYLSDGDMLSASQKASEALKIFKKQAYAAEAASCYVLMTDIYRLCCINDVAETMIDAAIDLYRQQKLPLFEARSLTIKGMLMLFENRYEEADCKYEQALNLPITKQLTADIFNQQALSHLAQNRLNKAEKYAKNALLMQTELHNPHGTSFSLQLLSQISFRQQHYRLTEKYADEALKIYTKKQNPSAVLECLYLKASAQCRQNRFTSAEKLLREILKLSRKQQNNFHIANAYSLLGLIYMQTKDFQRAKVLFQQSLHLEQSHQRNEGLAADYNNLAIIENINGNLSEAANNMNIAREYAQKTGDEELIKIIENRCNNMT